MLAACIFFFFFLLLLVETRVDFLIFQNRVHELENVWTHFHKPISRYLKCALTAYTCSHRYEYKCLYERILITVVHLFVA